MALGTVPCLFLLVVLLSVPYSQGISFGELFVEGIDLVLVHVSTTRGNLSCVIARHRYCKSMNVVLLMAIENKRIKCRALSQRTSEREILVRANPLYSNRCRTVSTLGARNGIMATSEHSEGNAWAIEGPSS